MNITIYNVVVKYGHVVVAILSALFVVKSQNVHQLVYYGSQVRHATVRVQIQILLPASPADMRRTLRYRFVLSYQHVIFI